MDENHDDFDYPGDIVIDSPEKATEKSQNYEELEDNKENEAPLSPAGASSQYSSDHSSSYGVIIVYFYYYYKHYSIKK